MEKRAGKTRVEFVVCPDRIELEGVLRSFQKQYPEFEANVTRCETAERLGQILSRFAQECRGQEWMRFPLKIQEGLHLIPLRQIIYCKSLGHRIQVYLTNGQCLTSLTMRYSFAKAVGPLVSSGQFLQCSASSAVNMGYIRLLRDTELVLDDGTILPFPARRQAETRETLEQAFSGA